MKTGLNLVELAQKIEANRALKHDMIVDTSKIEMEIDSDKTPLIMIPRHEQYNDARYPIRPLAHDQIGGRLNIPGKYYDRMLSTAPELLATNVNTWLRKNPEKRMLRTLGGDLRAFLSNRYQRIENEEIAEVALPVLSDIPDVQFVSTEVTERRLYIQAVAPRIQGEVKKGDIVRAGVVISNSEVGCGAVSVSPMIWRLVCLNGMICPDGRFRAYHVGRRIEDSAELWAQDTVKADDRAVLLKVRDMVRAAVDSIRFTERVAQMSDLATARIEGDPAKVVEVLAKKVGASETERGGILRSLIENGDTSAWGLLNAVTAQAHTAESYDRAVEFEAAGGALLELDKKEWREVLQAA